MMGSFRSVLLGIFLLCGLSACVGDAPEPPPLWRLVALEGVVQINDEGQAFRPAVLSELLNEGSVLATGSESTAQLSNGLQMMTVSANSRLRIPENRGDGFIRILQEVGRVLFQVDRRYSPHFEVLTPLATAVVKGTTFEVRVSSERTTVQVTDGLVEVRSTDGDTHRDVPSDYQAHIIRAQPREVVVYPVAQAGSSSAASTPGNARNRETAPDPDGSSPVLDPVAGNPIGFSDIPGAAGMTAVTPGGNSRTQEEGAAPTSTERVSDTVEAGPSASGRKAPEPSQTSAVPIRPGPAPTRAAAQANGKEADDASTVIRYAMWVVIAWIVFVPAIVIGKAMLRRRKTAPSKKRRDP